ncbi:MAG: hypothetical protein BalsKO_18710 [Balneolaceae bacterium]
MNQLSVKNDSMKSFVFSTGERDLKSVISIVHFLHFSYSFDKIEKGLKNISCPLKPTPQFPPMEGKLVDLTLNYFEESLLLRGEQEVCFK